MKKSFLFFVLSQFVAVSVFASIKVAITVDDLPTHQDLPPGVTREMVAKKMTQVLRKHKIPEVYGFINAGKVEKKNESKEVLKIWKKAGYPFGNHTYLHEDINKVSLEDYKKSIELNEPMLKQLSGKSNWKFFRYPYLREGETLETRNTIRSFLKDHGYQIAQVTIDFEDWSWNGPYSRCVAKQDQESIAWLEQTYIKNAIDMLDRAEVLSQSLFKRSIPHVLLLHIGAFDAEMIDKLITEYKKKGVEFIPLSEAQKDEVYSLDPALPAKRGSELTYQFMNARNLKLADVGLKKYEDYPEEKLQTICQ
ncbi:polysaccharide deacetylase family protein [Bdellovibrio sp. BCCA]|uniref:polysaccharide deacetylase family protein n=1 Tax=Bdellovibrio sp. BCCA TaxID=3136281 RepID=UPI0030F0579A